MVVSPNIYFGAESCSTHRISFWRRSCTMFGTLVPRWSKPVLGSSWHRHSRVEGGLLSHSLCPHVASAVHAYNSPQVTLMPKFQLRCRVLQHTPHLILAAKLHHVWHPCATLVKARFGLFLASPRPPIDRHATELALNHIELVHV